MSIWSDKLALIASDTSPLAALLRDKVTRFGAQYDASGVSQGVLGESAAHSAWRQQSATVDVLGARIASSTLPGAAALRADYSGVQRAVTLSSEPRFFGAHYYALVRWVGLERKGEDGLFQNIAYHSYGSPRVLPIEAGVVFQFFAGYSSAAGGLTTPTRVGRRYCRRRRREHR